MNIQEKKYELESLNIHDLRNIGRLWGIASPTLLKKNALINKIIAIMSGEEKPEVTEPNHKSGRPVKTRISAKEIETKFFPDAYKEYFSEFSTEEKNPSELVFAQYVDNEVSGFMCNNEGYLCERESFYFFYDTTNEELVFVPKLLVIKYALEIGDFLQTMCSNLSEQGFNIAREIKWINHNRACYMPRELIDFKKIVINDNALKIGDIVEGSIVNFINPDCYNFVAEKKELINKFLDSQFQIMVVAVGLQADGLLRLKKIINFKPFVNYIDGKPLLSFETVSNAINHATLMARGGKKVLLIVLNLEKLFNEIDLYFSSKKIENEMHTFKTTSFLRKLTSLNRTLENGGSITILTTSSESFSI